ncbi:MAG: type VI secretion system Vgr family protein [Gemmatimonadaceae bacterium]
MASLAQAGRPMRLTTPLGGDTLVIEGLSGRETVSRQFVLTLDLISLDSAIDPTKLLRKPVCVTVDLTAGGSRYFHGLVNRFSQLGRDADQLVSYRAEVVPWTWFLSATTNSRIFQQMSVPDIVKKIFSDRSLSDYRLSLSGTYSPRDYCVQYRETDLDFVSRLLEEEGIFYYFEHAADKHTLVIADSPSAIKVGPLGKMAVASTGAGGFKTESITAFEVDAAFFSGKVGVTDYNMETPSLNLLSGSPTTISGIDNTTLQLYDYPGKFGAPSDGDRYARLQMEQAESTYSTVSGGAVGAAIACGTKVEVNSFYRRDANKLYLVLNVAHSGTQPGYRSATAGAPFSFTQSFTGMPATVIYHPPRLTPKAVVRGAQTALVVGPAGEEIFTDKYSRVKVQFFWDQQGKKDDNSSCWVRVSSVWAGKQWGFIQIPRIGQEVIVDFLEGDPDRPIIVGRVYNADQMPPYTLPANKTQSGVLTRSSAGGSPATANELRFEDKKGSEEILLHAEKDRTIEVEHDETHWVGNDRTKNVDHDETVHVKHDRTETVDNNETIAIHGSRTETVDKDETISIHGNRTETVDKDESVTVSGNRTTTISKNLSTTVGQADSLSVADTQSVSVGKDQTVSIGGAQTEDVGKDRSVSVAGADTLSISKGWTANANGSIAIESKQGITIKCGQNSITIDQSGIQINGMQVKLDSKTTADIHGLMTSVKADAMLTVKGAITMIN